MTPVRLILSLVLAVALGAPFAAAAPVRVVATFSILGDMVREIGGEDVAPTVLVGPDGDAHAYEPTPADVRTLNAADVLVANGLGFETWLSRLTEASDFAGATVFASDGAELLAAPDGDEPDPHAWQDLRNGARYAANIATALIAADPANEGGYAARAADYVSRILALDSEVRAALAALPEERRKIVTSHDAFAYFGAAYGVDFIAPEGLSTDAEPTPGTVAAIITQIRRDGIAAVFVENITDPRLIEQIAGETGAVVGDTLYSDALSGPDRPASTYLAMFEWNAAALLGSLGAPVQAP